MTDLVSVNVTTHNRAELLKRCIESILKQTYTNMEIVIVDDCSKDNTEEIVKKYRQKDDRIKYFKHDINKGNAYARNTALGNCTGYYIAFMDDDDEWIDENKIQKQVEIFENSNNENLGIICSSVRLFSDKNTFNDTIITRPKNLVSHILSRNGIIYSPTVMTKRDIMIEVGGFDTNLPRGVDSDFYRMCIVKFGYDVYFMQDVTTAIYEYGSDRMTPKGNEKSILKDVRSSLICLEKYQDEFKLHKKAKMYRKRNVIKNYIKLFILTKQAGYIFEAFKVIII